MREDYFTNTPDDAAAYGSACVEPEPPEFDIPDGPETLTRWEVQVMRSRVHLPPREEWPTLLEHLQRGAERARAAQTYDTSGRRTP